MTQRANNCGEHDMKRAVDMRRERSERWRREGERSIWQNLSMVGALGWLIVTPILLGVLCGHWLDTIFDTGIFYTGALIVLGAGFGSYLAWQRVHKE